MSAPLQQPLGLVVADLKDRNGTLLVNREVIILDQETGSPVRIYPARTANQPIGIGEYRTNSSGRISFFAVKGRALVIRSFEGKEMIAEVGELRPDSWFSFADSKQGPEGPAGPDEATELKSDLETSVDAAAILQSILDGWAQEWTDDGRTRELNLGGANVKLMRPLRLWDVSYSNIKLKCGRLYPDTTQSWATDGANPEKSLIELSGSVSKIILDNLELDGQDTANNVLNLSTGGEHSIIDCYLHNFASWGIEDAMGGVLIDGSTRIEQYQDHDPEFSTQPRRTAIALCTAGFETVVAGKTEMSTSRYPLKLGMDWDVTANLTLGDVILTEVKGAVTGTVSISSNIVTSMSSTEPLRAGMMLFGDAIIPGTRVVKVLTTTSVQMSNTALASGVATIQFEAGSLLYPGTRMDAPTMLTATTKVEAQLSGTSVRLTEPALQSGIATPISARKGAINTRMIGVSMLNPGPTSTPDSKMGTFWVGRDTAGATLQSCKTSRGMARIWSTNIAILDHNLVDDPTLTSTNEALFQLMSSVPNQTLDGFEFKPHSSMRPLAGSAMFALVTGLPGTSWNVAGVAGLAFSVQRIEHGRTTTVDGDTIQHYRSLQSMARLIIEAIGTTTPVELTVEGNALKLTALRFNGGSAIFREYRDNVTELAQNYTFTAADSKGVFIATNTTPKTWVLPHDLPVGWNIKVLKTGAGSLSILPDGGATLDGELSGMVLTGGKSLSCIKNVDGQTAVYSSEIP